MRNRTKTLLNAQNYSNDSSRIDYSGEKPDVIMGDSLFGDMDIDDVYNKDMISVENILQDLMGVTLGSIGDVVIRTEKNSPAGFAQLDRWTFLKNDGFIYFEDTYINILGQRVLMARGSVIEAVVAEVQRVIQDYIDNGKYFKSVKVNNDLELEVEYADRRIHNPIVIYDDPRVIINKTIIRNVVMGYGNWMFMGEEKKTLNSEEQILYYYKRIG